MDKEKFFQGIEFLSQQGLNLCAVLDCAALPEDIAQPIQQQKIPLDRYARLVLLGHGGKRLWQTLAEFGMQTADPVDYYSLVMAARFIDKYLDSPPVLTLYPSAYAVPLQRLGALAGWHHPSPLGIGINERYGVWFAYRVAFLTTLELPLIRDQVTASPCDTCQDKPCLAACPVGAVRQINELDLAGCIDFRLQEKSVCQDRCLSRLACPVAPEHRYSLEQISYHYRRSLESIHLYQAGQNVTRAATSKNGPQIGRMIRIDADKNKN